MTLPFFFSFSFSFFLLPLPHLPPTELAIDTTTTARGQAYPTYKRTSKEEGRYSRQAGHTHTHAGVLPPVGPADIAHLSSVESSRVELGRNRRRHLKLLTLAGLLTETRTIGIGIGIGSDRIRKLSC